MHAALHAVVENQLAEGTEVDVEPVLQRLLADGLDRILDRLHATFDIRCDVHMESHPHDLTAGKLQAIAALGVRHLSTGVEALQDRHLRYLGRPYDAAHAQEAVRRAVGQGFTCVNADLIFDLLPRTGARPGLPLLSRAPGRDDHEV